MEINKEPLRESLTKDVTFFAKTNFRDRSRLFGIKRLDRRQHMYVVGKTGVGKSALLHNLIVQDITNGEGLCVIDPHGELVEEILGKIPEERKEDVVYFNPADQDYHIGFNVLDLPDPKYKHLVASGLISIFTKIWANVWSARMEYILNNAILALLEAPNISLMALPRLLVDKIYRQEIIKVIKDPVVKSFWDNEYEEWRDQFRNEAIAPIQNKVGQFLASPIIRNVVGQTKSTVDLFDIMNEGKILLVNVSKGRLGEDNSQILGAMLITKLQLLAMERVRLREDERVDFYLYVDEFQNFATDSFASALSEARKYRLNMIIAHQYIGQLVTDISTKVRDSIFGNAGTMIVFRCGAADAEFLEKEFEPEFMAQDLINLPNYQIYIKLMVKGVTSRPFSAATLPPFKIKRSEEIKEKIIDMSRKKYSRPRYVVEQELAKWSTSTFESLVEGGGEGKHEATCSNCGKKTFVPFEPIEGRPVYCRECLTGIKSGNIRPVSVGTREKQSPQKTDSLANLGIEFNVSDKKSDSGERPTRPEKRKSFSTDKMKTEKSRPERQPSILRKDVGELPHSNEPVREMSLENLRKSSESGKEKEKRTEEKEGSGVDIIKEEIQKALKKLKEE